MVVSISSSYNNWTKAGQEVFSINLILKEYRILGGISTHTSI